jgi:hypothetical protein
VGGADADLLPLANSQQQVRPVIALPARVRFDGVLHDDVLGGQEGLADLDCMREPTSLHCRKGRDDRPLQTVQIVDAFVGVRHRGDLRTRRRFGLLTALAMT